MANSFYYQNEFNSNLIPAPDVYSVDIALENFLCKILDFTPDRIIYASNDNCLRERTRLNKGLLKLPFLNYHKTSYSENDRQWFNNRSNMNRFVPDDLNIKLGTYVKYFPIKIEYECTVFFDQDKDKELAIKKLMYGASNESFIKPEIMLSNGDSLVIPCVVNYDIDFEPNYTEQDWLENNKIHTIGISIECNTIMVIAGDNKTGIATSVALEFLAKKYGDDIKDVEVGIREYFEHDYSEDNEQNNG